jgi:hypothetical protein
VEITGMTVSGFDPDDTVSIKAEVRNDSATPGFGVQAMLWHSTDPITDLATLRDATERNTSWGSRMWSKPAHFRIITTSEVEFRPGESRKITLEATLADLGFTKEGAVYPFGVQVLATQDASSNYSLFGGARTFVSIPGELPVPVTEVVVLAAKPTKIIENVFADDSLAGELAGRLDALLDAVSPQGGMVFDPALIDEVADMADGYELRTPDGNTPGTGQWVAASWLARFNSLAMQTPSVRSVFANPDLSGADGAEGLARARRADAESSPPIVVPAGFAGSAALLEAIGDGQAQAVLVDNARDGGAVQGASETMVLAASRMGDRPGILQDNYLLAETLVSGAGGQLRLIVDPEDASGWAEVRPDWTTPRSLGAMLSSPTSGKAKFVERELPALSQRQHSAALGVQSELDTYRKLVPGTLFETDANALFTRAMSSAWIGDEAGQRRYLSSLSALIGRKAMGAGVGIQAAPLFSMTSQENEFPVTVTNNLAETIRVKVVTESLSPQRLAVPDSDVVEVEPGVSQTVNIRPQSKGNGVIEVRSHVATTDGARVTPNVRITVNMTNFSLIGWAIVIGSGTALFVLTGLHIHRRSRKNKLWENPPEAASRPSEPEGTAPSTVDDAVALNADEAGGADEMGDVGKAGDACSTSDAGDANPTEPEGIEHE